MFADHRIGQLIAGGVLAGSDSDRTKVQSWTTGSGALSVTI